MRASSSDTESERPRHTKRGRGRGRGSQSSAREKESESDQETDSECNSASVQCPVCKLCESDDEDNTNWVLCDNPECATWYHVDCVDIDNAEDMENVMWLCPVCC